VPYTHHKYLCRPEIIASEEHLVRSDAKTVSNQTSGCYDSKTTSICREARADQDRDGKKDAVATLPHAKPKRVKLKGFLRQLGALCWLAWKSHVTKKAVYRDGRLGRAIQLLLPVIVFESERNPVITATTAVSTCFRETGATANTSDCAKNGHEPCKKVSRRYFMLAWHVSFKFPMVCEHSEKNWPPICNLQHLQAVGLKYQKVSFSVVFCPIPIKPL